jgi:hypothetical protein
VIHKYQKFGMGFCPILKGCCRKGGQLKGGHAKRREGQKGGQKSKLKKFDSFSRNEFLKYF